MHHLSWLHLIIVAAALDVNGGSFCSFTFALASPSPTLGPRSIISRKANGNDKLYEYFTEEDLTETTVNKPVVRHDSSSRKNRMAYMLRSTFLPLTSNTASSDKSDTTNSDQMMTTLKQSGYLSYMIYDNLQDLTTSLRSVLATQRVLQGVGVGRSDATALSATLNFLLRDGCGMIASLLFTSIAASTFRRNIKRWKYFADIMVDLGITLEIIAPSVLATQRYRALFLPLLCVGSTCKALCGVAAGATGGALQMYWAVKLTGDEEGISEVSAKSGAQRTVMGGLGLILAGLTARWLDGGGANHTHATWISIYCILTFLHLALNWMSMKIVALDWLNGWRLHKVVNDFLLSIDDINESEIIGAKCISPAKASRAEPIFFPELFKNYPTIRMGVSFNDLVQASSSASTLLSEMTQKMHCDKYILKVGNGGRCILVSFLAGITNKSKTKAYLHACLTERALLENKQRVQLSGMIMDESEIQHAEQVGQDNINVLWSVFERCTYEKGWKLEKTEISTDGYEIIL